MTKFSIRKDVATGQGFKYRVKVKAFKSCDAMHKFLNAQYDNLWSIMQNPLKSGTYIERGLGENREMLNIRSIEPSALAHM